MPVIGVQKNCTARAIITSVSGRVTGAKIFSRPVSGAKLFHGQQFFAAGPTSPVRGVMAVFPAANFNLRQPSANSFFHLINQVFLLLRGAGVAGNFSAAPSGSIK